MSNYAELIETLLQRYSDIMQEKGTTPDWAVHKVKKPDELVKCTIPFVGRDYASQKTKILVYASAENLEGYYLRDGVSWPIDLDDDSIATNRHRYCFDEWCNRQDSPRQDISPQADRNLRQNDDFFPYVHLGPIENGALSTSVLHIASKLGVIGSVTPREFYDTIAFANYSKYSLETEHQYYHRTGLTIDSLEPGEKPSKSNIDIAEDKDRLRESHDFIRVDIEILKPDYVIIPRKIFETDLMFFHKAADGAKIVPIFQMMPWVFNRYIIKKYPKYNQEDLHPTVRTWYTKLSKDGIVGKTKENYLAVFSHLDDVMDRKPKLGPFFYIRNQLIYHTCSPDEARRQADKLDNSYGHESLYDAHFRTGDYIDYPRGRVIWDTTHQRAIVYIDPCINRQDVLAKIVTAFELTDFVIEPDEHYHCKQCVGEQF